MNEMTDAHFAQIERAIKHAKNILARFGYPDDIRTVMVVGFLSQNIEHHEAMLSLCRSGHVGSAFALARSIFEGVYRGMWINLCANAEQIASFNRDDRFPVNMTQMAKDIDAAYRAEGFFESLRSRGWESLCSYTHSGLLQLGRRFTQADVAPNYSEEEIYEVSTTTTTLILLLVGKFLAVQGHSAECLDAEALVDTYGPRSNQNADEVLPA